MDFMMIKSILASLVVLAAIGAHAEDRLSAQKWSEDFAAALKSKNASATLQMVDFDKLDKKYLNTCSDCGDKALMEKARKLYAKGQYDEARALYDQVAKGSTYWLQAVEEKAWTFYRQNQIDASLAQAKTLLAPQFAGYVGSEAYFLRSLANLKVCNYKEVFETNRLFKEKQKPRLAEIQNLSKTGMNDAVAKILTSTENFPMNFSEVSEAANHLPQLFYKDIEFQRQLMRYKLTEKALAVLKAEGNSENLQASFEKTKAASQANLQARMKQLAVQETNDNFKIIQKINLVEVEAIQRLHIDVDMDKKLFKKDDFSQTNADQLVFVDDGRPWIDELDKYQVRVKACPQNIRRKM
jgi:hypothetical protein